MGSHSAVTTSPGGNRHLISPAAPGFHTQGLLPWRPPPEAPPSPRRLGISAVSLFLSFSLCFIALNTTRRREEGRTSSPRKRDGESPLREVRLSCKVWSLLKPVWAPDNVGQDAQSFLLVTKQVLMELGEDVCVCVCVLPSQNWQVPRGVLIRKLTMRMGDSRHLASDRCCSRHLSAHCSI